MWRLATQTPVLLSARICRPAAGVAPLRTLHCIVGTSGIYIPLAVSEGGLSERWASAKRQSRLSHQSRRLGPRPLGGRHPSRMSQDALQRECQELLNSEDAAASGVEGRGRSGEVKLQKAGGSARNRQSRLTDVFPASASLLVFGRWGAGTRQLKTWIRFK